jgi:hypothetical protein
MVYYAFGEQKKLGKKKRGIGLRKGRGGGRVKEKEGHKMISCPRVGASRIPWVLLYVSEFNGGYVLLLEIFSSY